MPVLERAWHHFITMSLPFIEAWVKISKHLPVLRDKSDFVSFFALSRKLGIAYIVYFRLKRQSGNMHALALQRCTLRYFELAAHQ